MPAQSFFLAQSFTPPQAFICHLALCQVWLGHSLAPPNLTTGARAPKTDTLAQLSSRIADSAFAISEGAFHFILSAPAQIEALGTLLYRCGSGSPFRGATEFMPHPVQVLVVSGRASRVPSRQGNAYRLPITILFCRLRKIIVNQCGSKCHSQQHELGHVDPIKTKGRNFEIMDNP